MNLMNDPPIKGEFTNDTATVALAAAAPAAAVCVGGVACQVGEAACRQVLVEVARNQLPLSTFDQHLCPPCTTSSSPYPHCTPPFCCSWIPRTTSSFCRCVLFSTRTACAALLLQSPASAAAAAAATANACAASGASVAQSPSLPPCSQRRESVLTGCLAPTVADVASLSMTCCSMRLELFHDWHWPQRAASPGGGSPCIFTSMLPTLVLSSPLMPQNRPCHCAAGFCC
eukprot:1142242-Pelagomonas_calceolata.AAC.3